MRRTAVISVLLILAVCCLTEGKSVQRKGAEYSSQPSEGSREEEHHPVKQWYEAAQKAAPSQRRYPRAISGREEWWKNGQEALARAVERQRLNMGVAKNIIIFIGDGMGVSTVSAARIFEGYERDDGVPGEQNLLSFEKFPFTGLAKTYNADWQVPDSAGSATAILCGIKSRFNMVAMDESAIQFLCSTQEGAEVDSILYWAEAAGKSTGVVTNTGITHATPAAAYANSVSRNYEKDTDIIFPWQNCTDIAAQLIERGHDIEVAMGGARSKFFPRNVTDPVEPTQRGDRADGRNLVEEWEDDKKSKGGNYKVVFTADELEQVDLDKTDYLFGLFARGHMSYHEERPAVQPSLSQMTEAAVRVLQKNEKGFFLVVEGGRIDMAHHASRTRRAMIETLEFSRSVETAVNMTNEDDTLIIVTADHSHVFTFAGYHLKGSDILGKGIYPAEDLMPYTKLLYGNGPGYAINSTTCRRENIREVNTSSIEYVAQSSALLSSETHGGEDVAIYARGPMAHLLSGVQEQHYIAHAAAYAACIGENRDHCAEESSPTPSAAGFPSASFRSFVGLILLHLVLHVIC